MSLVYITYHDENIINCEKDFSFKRLEVKRYVSKNRKHRIRGERELDTVVQEDGKKILTSAFKSAHKTMGHAEVPLKLPCEFLRKNQGVKWQRRKDHVCPKPPFPMPDVPRLSVLKKPGPIKRKHNFIEENVKIAINAQVKRNSPKYVDRHTGTPRNLLNSGLLPQHVCAKDFARVPCYLRVRKKLLQKAAQRCKEEKQELVNQCISSSTGLRELTSQEIQTILAGLKKNLAEVYKTYQCLSINTDTLPKRLQKSKVEKELRQLENDIFLMESNPVIFVSEF